MHKYILTRQLKLRQINLEDIKLIVEWGNSKTANGEYLSLEGYELASCEAKFKSDYFWNDKAKTFLIELKINSQAIGTINYWTKAEEQNAARMAIKIALPEYRQKGLGVEAQVGLINELFIKYDYDFIEMLTDINNLPQQKCLKKLNFLNLDLQEYDDQGTRRQGYLFRVDKQRFKRSLAYTYYYGVDIYS